MDTTQDRGLEFRVLSGQQAGARIRLPKGSYTLGSDSECDIILRGPGIASLHLRLEVDGRHPVLHPVSDDCSTAADWLTEETELARGLPFRAAQIWLQVAEEAAAWPDVNDLPAELPPKQDVSTAGSGEAERMEESTGEASDGSSSEMPPELEAEAASGEGAELEPVRDGEADMEAASSQTAAAARTDMEAPDGTPFPESSAMDSHDRHPAKKRWRIGVLAASMLATLLCGAVAVAVVKPDIGSLEDESSSAASRKRGYQNPLSCAQQIVTKLGMVNRIALNAKPNGETVASGHTVTNADLTILQASLKRDCPTVGIDVYSDQSVAAGVRVALKRHDGYWALEHVRQGRAMLKRLSGDGPPIAVLRTELTQTVSGLAAVAQILPALKDTREELSLLLRQAGLSSAVAVIEQDNRLQVIGNLSGGDLQKWEEVRLQMQRKFGPDVPLSARFDQRRNTLPFHIHQVVSGPMPFVVPDDGTRLFEGGSMDGYQLVSIKEDRLVFAGLQSVEISW